MLLDGIKGPDWPDVLEKKKSWGFAMAVQWVKSLPLTSAIHIRIPVRIPAMSSPRQFPADTPKNNPADCTCKGMFLFLFHFFSGESFYLSHKLFFKFSMLLQVLLEKLGTR